jgi:DNA-binding CsgD family transcriptional regulator
MRITRKHSLFHMLCASNPPISIRHRVNKGDGRKPSPAFTSAFMGEKHDPLAIERLTPRERECLRLVAEHLHSKEIARRLSISQHTVDGHLNEARRRLGVSSRRDAARLLRDWESGHPPSMF